MGNQKETTYHWGSPYFETNPYYPVSCLANDFVTRGVHDTLGHPGKLHVQSEWAKWPRSNQCHRDGQKVQSTGLIIVP